MSANKFKVGDKVKVRKGLIGGEYYDNIYCTSGMANSTDEVFTVSVVSPSTYKLEGYDLWWNDEMLEPVEKTLDNLCAGNFIEDTEGIRKILATVDGCYLLSYMEDHDSAFNWYTVAELTKLGFHPVEPDASEPTIEIDGKKYKKADVEKAIKDLEVVD